MGCSASKAPTVPVGSKTHTLLHTAGTADVKIQAVAALRLEVIEANGLPMEVQPLCRVEVPGREETRRLTGKASACGKELSWGSTLELPGYRSGEGLRFTVLSEDSNTVFGEATLSAEQARAGFIGNLPLCGEHLPSTATLKVCVDGSGATVAEEVTHIVGEVAEAVEDAVLDAAATVEQAKVDLSNTKNRLENELQDVAADATEIAADLVAVIVPETSGGERDVAVQIESKNVVCGC